MHWSSFPKYVVNCRISLLKQSSKGIEHNSTNWINQSTLYTKVSARNQVSPGGFQKRSHTPEKAVNSVWAMTEYFCKNTMLIRRYNLSWSQDINLSAPYSCTNNSSMSQPYEHDHSKVQGYFRSQYLFIWMCTNVGRNVSRKL